MKLTEAAVAVLQSAAIEAKTAASLAAAEAWRSGSLAGIGIALPPDYPARPARPQILPPAQMPRRGYGPQRKAALLHALAHIEFNAIDLAWDVIARFSGHELPRAFYDDWVAVAEDETRHFLALRRCLNDLGADYGDFPAHDGLWDAAAKTADNLAARLAVVPLALEARSLDTGPAAIARLTAGGDGKTAEVLQTIVDEEVRHVAVGVRWFTYACQQAGSDPEATYRRLIAWHFPKGLKPPFNKEARERAGFPSSWYEARPLASV